MHSSRRDECWSYFISCRYFLQSLAACSGHNAVLNYFFLRLHVHLNYLDLQQRESTKRSKIAHNVAHFAASCQNAPIMNAILQRSGEGG